MRCSLIIPTRDRHALLEGCLVAVTAQRHRDYEVIVVDDGSRDRTAEVVGKFPTVRYLRQDRLGQVAARNRGIAAADGELLAFTDDDCRPSPSWLEAHEAHYADAGIGGVGGPQIPMRPAFADRFYMAHYRREYTDRFRVERIAGWERALTGNFSMRRAVVERLGDFDCRFLSGSDADQMRRIVRAGWAYVNDPALGVAHEKRHTLVSCVRERFRKASGSLMTDVKEGSLSARRFVPLVSPAAIWERWADYRAMFGGAAPSCAAFFGLAIVTRLAEVAGRAYFYRELVLRK